MGESKSRPDDLPAGRKPKLLVMELWGVGDLIMATPFLVAASEKFSVTLLAKPYAQDLQRRFWPEVEVVPFVAPWTAFEHKYRVYSWPWRQFLQLGRQLGRARFDVGVSARWDPRDHLLLAMLRVHRRIGFTRAGSGLLLNEPVERPAPGSHRYEHWRVLGEALGLSLPGREVIPMPAPRRGCILVHTGAAQRVRVWPLERFRTVVTSLRRGGFEVEVACDTGQREWWMAAGETDVATPRTVGELLELTNRAAVFIGNDSGPGHLAAFNGVPTFTLFGPQLPALFAPLHRDSTWVEGMPCPYRPCSDYCRFPVPHCLWDLSGDAVWPRVQEFVARHAGLIRRSEVAVAATAADEFGVGTLPAPASPRRVLHINNSADIYGASRNLLRLLKHIDRRRIQPMVILPEPGPLQQLIEAEGIEVILHPRLSVITRQAFQSWKIILFFLNYPVSVFYLWRLIRRRRIELVHTNTGVMVSPALAAHLAGIGHIWHIRDWFQEFRRIWPAFSWYVRTLSQKVIAVSNAIARQFDPYPCTTVIHDGLSLDEFQVPREERRLSFRARYGLGQAFVVGCVGRIKLVRKGQEVLVQATALLKERGRHIKALIVGAPFRGNEGHLEQIQALVQELGIGDSVVFTGELPDARAAYASMDIMALTSAQPEPFGTVVMEAMAMGVPVIATNIGGSLDQVLDGVTGLLVPPADPVALADAIEKLMVDDGLRERMGRAAVQRIRKDFSLVQMTRDVERVFEETISARKS
jgi:glycosyltransferase involved in cell wall biosynthesis/ADP-heptose:LPS heptosyltransferase